MADYNDLFIRSFMGDTNKYPKPASSSAWTSPDIIPYGIKQSKDPKDEFLGKNFNSTLTNGLIQTMNNYIYIRAKNYANKTQKGQIYLYWSPSQLLLSPGLWEQNVIESTKGQGYVDFEVGAGQQYITTNDDKGLFNWNPNAIKGDHYCLVSRVVTDDHRAPIPNLKDIHDFTAFMLSDASMGYAQRNISVVDTGAASYVSHEELNAEYEIKEGYININCENVPEGWDVALSCSGSSSKCFLEIERTRVSPNSRGNFVTGVHFYNMPKGFSSKVNLYIWFNGIKQQQDFDVKVEFLSVETPNTSAYHLAQPLESFGWNNLCTTDSKKLLTGNDLGNFLAAIQPKRAVKVGCCSHVNKQ